MWWMSFMFSYLSTFVPLKSCTHHPKFQEPEMSFTIFLLLNSEVNKISQPIVIIRDQTQMFSVEVSLNKTH